MRLHENVGNNDDNRFLQIVSILARRLIVWPKIIPVF